LSLQLGCLASYVHLCSMHLRRALKDGYIHDRTYWQYL